MIQYYSIFDKKTVSFERPFPVKHVAEALRAVQAVLEDPKHPVTKHAADYALYMVGSFDGTTGAWIPTASQAPQFTCELLSLFPRIPPQGGSDVQVPQ